jgi:hypothetical protein
MVPAENKAADTDLNEFGYDLIVRDQYDLATKILHFGARELRGHSSERMRRTLTVNLANALKLKGQLEESRKTLASVDWSDTSDVFRLCVAAVEGDCPLVAEIMKKVGAFSEDMTANHYQEWPVFYHVRDNPLFAATFKKVFGTVYVPAARERASLSQIVKAVAESGELNETTTNEDPRQGPAETVH